MQEIQEDPERFFLLNKDQKVRIAGRFLKTSLSEDGNKAYASVVWSDRFSGVACVSSERDEMLAFTQISTKSDVIVTGTLYQKSRNWMYLSGCTIKTGVTLFHDRDPELILGSWCMVLNGKTFRKEVFTREPNGQFHQQNYDAVNGVDWSPWRSSTLANVTRYPSQFEVEIVNKGRVTRRTNYTIVNPNKMTGSNGAIYYRCQ